MNYRPYSPDDFAQIYAIEELCFHPPERFGRRYMRQLVSAANAATWIAEEDGRIAGFAIVEWSKEPPQHFAYLQTIEVDPQHRGRGVAGELLRRAEGSSLSAGADIIWLHVEEQNHPAIRLYQSNGYLCKGREGGYYGPGRAALVYAKPILARQP